MSCLDAGSIPADSTLSPIKLSFIGLLFLIIWLSFIKIFSKGGESGWKALIPLFAIFIWVKILKKPIWWFAIYLILPVGYILLAIDASKLFGKKILYSIGLIFLPFIVDNLLG